MNAFIFRLVRSMMRGAFVRKSSVFSVTRRQPSTALVVPLRQGKPRARANEGAHSLIDLSILKLIVLVIE